MRLKKAFEKGAIEAGCDEAGRGCLAGPVVAAAVILPEKFQLPLLNDSKKLTHNQREILFPLIKEQALSWGIGVVSHIEIDQINILNASFMAMHRAIDQLQNLPERLLIDGNRFNPYKKVVHHCIIGGDGKYFSIAAASVLAKVRRDQMMCEMAKDYPQYDWENNKGYPTRKHRMAIEKYGACPLHRKSFKLLADEQLKMPI
ncbi:MAG: ribonuclease HII [Crocinitomicaceae bacterium]